jgi:midasin
MGEQSDAKTLFGAFVTNPARPGEFCWKAGVILEALNSGRWLVIEDVDLASPEMVATVKGLLESKFDYYVAPMGKSFPIHENFRLIATRRSDFTFTSTNSNQSSAFDRLGRDLWQSLLVPGLTVHELELLLFGRFPQLSPLLVNVILRLFGLVVESENSDISSNCLFKFCSRIVQLVNIPVFAAATAEDEEEFLCEDLRQALLYEAVDCFASSWNSREKRKELAKQMSVLLSLPEVQVDSLYENKPNISLNPDRSHLSIGRVGYIAEIQGMSRFRATDNASNSIALTTLSCQTLEKLAVAVKMNEPVLLVGETGTGKTTTVQHLAQMLQFQPNLRVLNMSQQSEASDLLGGFKPFSAQSLARPLLEEFLNIFGKAFSKSKNGEYLAAIQEAFSKQSWKRFVKLVKQAIELISSKLETVSTTVSPVLLDRLKGTLERFEIQVAYAANNLLFSFVEGSLVEALTEGHWLLLDEINLASPETLNILAGLLRSPSASVTLTERGDSTPIPRHPNFRLFACMNPATDVSKRDLPPAIRSRFTSIYVDETDVRRDDLRQVIDHLIGPGRDGTLKERLTALYYRLKDLVQSFELVDGNGRKPLLNLRTLTRPIKFARSCENIYGLERALYEGWCLSFTTMLDESSAKMARDILRDFLMPSISVVPPLRPFTSAISAFTGGKDHILVEGHVLLTGPLYDANNPQAQQSSFVLTPSVQRNVAMLARAAMARNYPILLEGPTSAGKTSVIEYLAKRTGHYFVRINNHEHTDIQEYLGTYVSDPDTGRLVFKEGILVQALRKGHWLVLDELNLAPSDILEALNRLLDDNRELFIPETGETVRPHPDFQLFATQNPAGAVYGGRKALSRAFRSRFLELQFNDLPLDEIEQILSSRCQIAPSFARRIAQVYRILQERRSTAGTNIFAGKHALITLRDCFRWAERHSHSAVGSTQELAQDGYFVLAERCRHPEETQFIRATLEKVCKTQLDSDFEMYNLRRICDQRGWTEDLTHLEAIEEMAKELKITWTKPIRRLFALVFLCIRFREPVILVGETGCGKTTVCQLVAQILKRCLRIVNCHANSESGDFLGSFRPVRNENDEDFGQNSTAKLFQWTDGPLVEAMKEGDLFLMDEISLADDSVLERLNSVLEPSRYLLLAECTENDEARVISASPNFAILATMNPGGDFGKKELSPALRNRFTEIWVPTIGDREDLQLIVRKAIQNDEVVNAITDFWYWWQDTLTTVGAGASILSASKRTASSLRDLLGLLQFCTSPAVMENIPKIELRILHGVSMIFTDRLGSENFELRLKSLEHLAQVFKLSLEESLQVIQPENFSQITVNTEKLTFSIGPFSLPSAAKTQIQSEERFAFEAPTTRVSALRVLRALQLGKAVLLEGSPGVGKTTLIGALASAIGHRLTRINLSEQTDLVDLFGSDLPVDGGAAGRFRWADGPFLQALKRGDWILLDELNLASQSVLEGLNACLDHRGRVFIPELGKEFECSPGTRIFAAQNPAGQGGGRKGLPKSFLNRFTVVWFDSLCSADYQIILSSTLSDADPLGPEEVTNMIKFNESLNSQIASFSSNGRPWEFNLRDLTRWIRLIQAANKDGNFSSPVQYIRALYASRFRCEEDFELVGKIVEQVFGSQVARLHFHQLPSYEVDSEGFKFLGKTFPLNSDRLLFLREQLIPLEASLMALRNGWLCILTGSGASGKSSLIDSLAHLHQTKLRRFFVSPDTDTLELLGSFEQVDYQRRWNLLLEEIQVNTSFSVESFSDFLNLSEDEISTVLNKCPESLKSRAQLFLSSAKNQSSEGRFEWVDGPLVRAMTLGHWLVLENVNLASSAVLDRLNSLFEPNGSLVLSEQGCTSFEGVRVISPSKGFRLFMTVDPKFGEISRAMRNRGIEIACFSRYQTRVLDDLQVLRQEVKNSDNKEEDPRIVPLLLRLLPLKPSRRLLHRISEALALLPSTSTSVDEILTLLLPSHSNSQSQPTSVVLSDEDSFWLDLNSSVEFPFIISSSVKNVPWILQTEMLKVLNSVDSDCLTIDNLALLSLFLVDWSSGGGESFKDRSSQVSNFLKLEGFVSSKLELLIEFVKNYFSLSPNHLILLENLKTTEKSLELVGYLLWMLSQEDEVRAFQVHEQAIRRLSNNMEEVGVDAVLTVDLENWIKKWRHFGFKKEKKSQIYLELRNFLCSERVLESSDSLQMESIEALETVLSSKEISSDLLTQLERFSQLLTSLTSLNSSRNSSSLSRTFLSSPLTLIHLNKIASKIIKNPSIPLQFLTQEWLSQVWSLSQEPLNFFSGFDGLGCLLETANRAWINRSTEDELELMEVFDDILNFVVKHGGKDKRLERFHLLKQFFSSQADDSSIFASDLISSSLQFLNSSSIDFDPVADHFLISQRSLSTTINFYTCEGRWHRIFNSAYLGSNSNYLIEKNGSEIISNLKEKVDEIDEFILCRPIDPQILEELKHLCTSRLRPLLSQVKDSLNQIQLETLQNSLLRLRMELISPRFILYRDLTSIFVDSIDRLKVGLYLKQVQENTQNSLTTTSILPLNFVSFDSSSSTSTSISTSTSNLTWTWTSTLNKRQNLISDTLTLNLARFIPKSNPDIPSLVLPILSRTIEQVHEAIKAEVARNTKNDSIFIFKGSNNDDDALDTELASELFGDFDKRAKAHEKGDFNEEELHDHDMDTNVVEPDFNEKKIDYPGLSYDLFTICQGIASESNDSKSLSEMVEILSRSFEFVAKTVNLKDFADPQVYRMLIWTLSEKLSRRRGKQGRYYDFYRDACPEGRLQEVLKILKEFQNRLTELLLEWPEHDVLQALQRQIERFFRSPVSGTSMIEALLAMEKLYLRSQDWEKYAASRHTSLGQCVTDLLHLIVDWRRAEVENWRGLIDAVVIKMEKDSIIRNGEWLSIARVALSHVEFEGKEGITTIMELIDTFVLAAPVGQFCKRLEILEFCTRLANLCATPSNRSTANSFNAALLYYQTTLAHRVKEYVRMCREPVERDLSAFLMTLYWKDINYWSVRQTAEKSHRHLAKMIRRWKESMQMPLSSLLNQLTIKAQLQIVSMENPTKEKVKVTKCRQAQALTLVTAPPPLTSLGIKVKNRLEALNCSCLGLEGGKVVETFGNTILETLAELKESTEPSIQHKQKAFVDLIRQLKVLGIRINKNPSNDLLAAKSILCTYAEATKLELPRDSKSEYYLIRTLEKWQKLVSTVAHEDITFRQAEIIKNSMAYLIETLICGKRREYRDLMEAKASKISSILDFINYRQNIKGIVKSVQYDFYTKFTDCLWMCQVQLAQISVMFESQKDQKSKKLVNWSLLNEIFTLTKSSFNEISNLIQNVKMVKGFSVVLDEKIFERISLLLSSLNQSVLIDFDELQDLQVSDLVSNLKGLVQKANQSWNSSYILIDDIGSTLTPNDISTASCDSLIRKILSCIQLCESEIPIVEKDEFNFYPDYLRKQAETTEKIVHGLISAIEPALDAVLNCFTSCPVELLEISYFSSQFALKFVDNLIIGHYRALARLTLILSNVFLHLYQEGFCRPDTIEEKATSEEESKDGKLTEGMGIGEGEGEKNVSKEIEFEEQVTGTLDEKDEQRDEDKKDDKGEDEKEDELDMSQDFDGALEDLMNEDDEDKEDENNDEKDEEMPQDQLNDEKEDQKNEDIQDLDPSWWDSDNENENEIEAPENPENQKLPDNKNPETKDDEKNKKDDEKKKEEDKEEQAMAAGEGEEDKKEDMEADSSENNKDDEYKDKSELSEDVDMDMDEEGERIEDSSEDEEAENDVEMESKQEIENEDFTEPEPENKDSKDISDNDLPEDTEMDHSEDVNPIEDPEEEDNVEDPKDQSSPAINENLGHDDIGQEQELDKTGDSSSSMQLEETSEDQQTGNEQQVKTFDTQGRSSNSQEEETSDPNSSEPIVDQVEKWKRTINRILNKSTTETSPKLDQSKLDKLTKEQQYEQAEKDDENAMTVKAEAEESRQITGEDDTSDTKAALNTEDPNEDRVDAVDENNLKDTTFDDSIEAEMKLVPHLKKNEDSISNAPFVDKDLEEHLRQLSLLPSWPEFEYSTSDLAFDLCEQLRLVLAPTQATKLRGDYRTGKRLNLRKILPYIASQYRRDKIWLRRTKPSQRNYRICLSIDNSKSMMETGSVGLAFEAIATISQALERLEVGELALVGFGEEARVLQQFSSGVAKVSVGHQLRSNLLNFDESSTDMPKLLETVLETFASAPSNNNGPIWQLNVILSDGICHQHDKIKPLLARCHSARILNIFVLLDNRPIESSIFELSHVEYVEQGLDPMTGQVKTGIKMTKYLETFPFEFYVVLRDVKMLPGVLAESLKQWFELISLQEGEH